MKRGIAPIAVALLLPVASLGCGNDTVRAEAEYKAQLKEHEAKVKDYERALRHAPNARCPSPRCGFALRISDGHIKRTVQCPKCLATFGGSRARAHWTPVAVPPPPTPPKPPGEGGFLRGLFG